MIYINIQKDYLERMR